MDFDTVPSPSLDPEDDDFMETDKFTEKPAKATKTPKSSSKSGLAPKTPRARKSNNLPKQITKKRKPAPKQTVKMSKSVKGGTGKSTKQASGSSGKQEKIPRKTPTPPPCILDGVDQSTFVGQFTRALRFCKSVATNATLNPEKLVDISAIVGAENVPVVDKESLARILQQSPSDEIRFSRRSVQEIRLISQMLCESKCGELKILCNMLKKQTLSMECVYANLAMHQHANLPAQTQLCNSMEENALAKKMLDGYHEINGPTKCNKTWEECEKYAKHLQIDPDVMQQEAIALLGERGPWVKNV